MFQKKTYKQKFRFLIVGFLLMALLSYIVSIRRTLDLRSECNALENQLVQLDDAPQRIAFLQKRLKKIEEVIGSNHVNSLDFQEALLERASTYCQSSGLILREFPETHRYSDQNFEVETNRIVAEGTFVKLLLLVYNLEQTFPLGRIVSVKFSSKEDFRSHKIRLSAIIYFQNVKNLKNENA